MPPVTTQPQVKAALQTRLAVRPGLAGVVVEYGDSDSERRETILLSTSFDTATLAPLVMRQNRNEEDYQLRVVIWSAKLETPAKTEARAEAIAEEIQAEVVSTGTPPFGLASVSWIRVAGTELLTEANADGPVTRLTVLLNVKARLV